MDPMLNELTERELEIRKLRALLAMLMGATGVTQFRVEGESFFSLMGADDYLDVGILEIEHNELFATLTVRLAVEGGESSPKLAGS